jgi:hypothetical protein
MPQLAWAVWNTGTGIWALAVMPRCSRWGKYFQSTAAAPPIKKLILNEEKVCWLYGLIYGTGGWG